MLMKHTRIKYALAAVCALAFAGALFGAPLAFRSVSADEPQNAAKIEEIEYPTLGEALTAWREGTTLTLLQDAETETIEVAGNKTLDLAQHILSLKAETSGSLLKVDGTLTVKNGTLTGGNAERGGGIYVDVLGNLTLENCTVSGNTAPQGGGVFVTGTLTLTGNTVVEGNTDGNGNASNIFLSPRNKILLNGFTGRAGVMVISIEEPFADINEENTGVFVSDDKRYVTENGKLKTAPLESITAVYENDGKVFPLTPLDDLKQFITVSGVNVNGIAYTGTLSFALSGTLSVGTSTLTVTAMGAGEETATTEIEVTVSKPSIVSIEVIAPEYPPKIYFDSPLSALAGDGGYRFRGMYEDGYPRFLSADGEDGYTLEGDLTKRTDGKATVTVHAGGKSATFEVAVSKYAVSLSQEDILELSALEGESLDARRFVPTLPAGVDVVATVGGTSYHTLSLSPAEYEVKVSFVVTDEENYEQIGSEFITRLTVLRRSLTSGEGGCIVEKKEGLLPAWSLHNEDISDAVTVKLDGSLEAYAVYEVTLTQDGVAVEQPGQLTVRLSLPEGLTDKEVTLFLLGADGSLSKVEATREEDVMIFSANSLSYARYVVAVETASQVYLILSIVFVVACLLGAAAVLGYLVYKRKKGR